MTDLEFDLVVIGSGPGGYVGAIRAAQLGLKTAIVEKDKNYGGTCLNVGCIPSKALLDSSEHYSQAIHQFKEHGLNVKGIEIDLAQMLKRKDKVVEDSSNGISYLFKKNNITPIRGVGKLKSATEVEVKTESGTTTLKAKNIMLATGSTPNELPGFKFDGKKIISSTEALCLTEIPNKMVVIGGGAIGLEMGSVWSRLGTKVTVIEYNKKICGGMDAGFSQRMLQILKKQGIEFILEAKVTGHQIVQDTVIVNFESLKDNSKASIEADICLVAAGRKPYSENLGLEELGIEKDPRGFVIVNEHYQTKYPTIYAVGDLIPGPMLAHKAEEEGVAAAELMAGLAGHVNYDTVPGVIYTWPEFASVGKTEEELKRAGIEYNVGQFPFSANGRARAANDYDGMVKVLAHKDSDKLLGVHIIGPRASDIIHEAIVAMEFGGSAEDLARSFHAHPTFPEAIREAALAVDKRARQI
jgi:dihydrolipoamide dehydrogenase